MNWYWILTAICFSVVTISSAKPKQRRIPVSSGYDPGPCNDTSHGSLVLVKDRDDDEVILVCTKNKDGYRWKSTDGLKSTVGEFFNPGYDCSDIMNKRENAGDGFYWITLKSPNNYQVWCDMSTDGGGFILVGRQNDSVTWSVASNGNPVAPYGEPHWLSSLGDAPIMDFRVQMATSEDLKSTKAHWSLRLNSKRPLKNLMTTSDGCDQRSAGIGNIAYVKDLLTEKIVTTKLRCSKFGFAHHILLKFGWAMMNSCLQKPCPFGFAYHPLVRSAQTDTYGAFSFSKTEVISGMEKNATAFVGCDNGHCCGCFGPVGGTKNYCAQNCKPINGGTVSKNVFSWFWIRTSLPKKIWKKCMDYQVTRADGKSISYKLLGHSVIPVEGRCDKAFPLLHDGIVVVPDSAVAQKVPAVDGLLEYRKDKQELYVRSKNEWSLLAKEAEVSRKISTLENMIKQINESLPFIHYPECSAYTWLTENSRNRNHLTTAPNYGSLKCDNTLSTGWHRFGGGAGVKMPTTCVGEHRCLGDFAGWMRGDHPTISDGKVTRSVCFSHGSNCCVWSDDIEVLNCGGYFVYKLSPPSRCRARYCGTF
ncbi:uncharacterized protein LOC114526893 [Dendronephthya gigantea]|uniref:uncharacterized protein LOC114526893 n=1 Tax=Dendronephthya gigantea TaxID=151771 RepID=UPI00106939B7|nr:uncharacterized protein LOC114526893 [Dendronephthya gigantea]